MEERDAGLDKLLVSGVSPMLTTQRTPKTMMLRTMVVFSGEVNSSYAVAIKLFSG